MVDEFNVSLSAQRLIYSNNSQQMISTNYAQRPIGDFVSAFCSIIYAIFHASIIILVTSDKQLRKKQGNRLLLNLSCGHFLTGMTNFFGTFTPYDVSNISFAWYIYANLSLLTLTVDRSLSIRWPFRYERLGWKSHLTFLMFSPISSLVYIFRYVGALAGRRQSGSRSSADNAGSMKFFIFGMSAQMVILLVSNSIVFTTVRRHKRTIKSNNVSSNENSRNQITRRRDVFTFYICFGCVITYVILWLPSLIIKILQFYGQYPIEHKYFALTMAVANVNPVSDAVLFVFFNREFKLKLKSVLRLI